MLPSEMTDVLKEMFPDPDDVGQSEYRAIYECIADGLADTPPEEQAQMAHSMLWEFHGWAHNLACNLPCPPARSDVPSAVGDTYADPLDSLICETTGEIWHTLAPTVFQDNATILDWLHKTLRQLVVDVSSATSKSNLPLERS